MRWYQPGVPAEPDIPDVAVPRLLDDAAARHPRRPALIFHGARIRYRDLREAADRFAAGLHRLGVQPGDRVALMLPNCPQLVIAFFGVLRRGAIAVPHNPLSTAEELRRVLADCAPRAAVVLDRSLPVVRAARDAAPLEHLIVTSLGDALPPAARAALRLPLPEARRYRAALTAEVPAAADAVPFAELQRPAERRVRQFRLDPSRHLAVIAYTGGEARPMGAMLTHRNLVANACQQHAWDVEVTDGGEVTLAVLPLFHTFGMISCLVAPVLKAGSVVLLPRFDDEQAVRALRRYRPTVFPGVPTLYDQVLDSPRFRPSDLDSVRVLLSGGSPLTAATRERLAALGHADGLIQAYGQTEASPALTANPLGGGARNDTVGLPLPGTDAVVVDPGDPTRPLPPGEPGELVARGPQVFAGYWNQPLATARVLSKGWLRTGDTAVMSADGWITLLERRQDTIKVSGFSVFPGEVEQVLRRHPAVFDCAVVGLPDERRGERVVAYVVEHPAYPFSAEELRRHCARYLSRYKVPAEFRLRQDLPRNMLGKVVRRRLRDAAAAG
ncbi:long-chain fatty acid--CoA ligase [Actinomadura keratinilytica]|uniref:Long-chain fatty acid--CoA ligase n=1 Tax=Actinomadura keratinilytica TaxID=547461 RepID=A0ABP6UIJ9_9ACTN